MIFGSLMQQLFSDHSPVQVLDGEGFEVLFESAAPMRLTVRDEKRATRFPVETGGERSDHVVDNAIEIAIEFVVTGHTARQQFQAMRQAYLDRKLVTVQTRMGSYPNMLIEAFPHEETVSISDGAVLPVRFIEWLEIQPEYGELQQNQVADAKQSSTVQRGAQTGSTPSADTEQRGSSIMGSWGLI